MSQELLLPIPLRSPESEHAGLFGSQSGVQMRRGRRQTTRIPWGKTTRKIRAINSAINALYYGPVKYVCQICIHNTNYDRLLNNDESLFHQWISKSNGNQTHKPPSFCTYFVMIFIETLRLCNAFYRSFVQKYTFTIVLFYIPIDNNWRSSQCIRYFTFRFFR